MSLFSMRPGASSRLLVAVATACLSLPARAQTLMTVSTPSPTPVPTPLPAPTPTPTPTPAPAPAPVPAPTPTPTPTPEFSAPQLVPPPTELPIRHFGLGYAVSPLGLFIPVKHGPFAEWRPNIRWGFDLRLLGGSLGLPKFIADVGTLKERNLSLVTRYSPGGGNFAWIFGVSYRSFTIELGDELVSRVTNDTYPSLDVVRLKSVAATLGLGSRFDLSESFVLGVDWLQVNIPVVQLDADAPFLEQVASEPDRRHVQDVVNVLKYVPTFALFRVELAWRF